MQCSTLRLSIQMRESKIEKDVGDIATRHGWYHRKFTSPARRSVPDRLFLRDGVALFVEFKAPGKRITKSQEHEHAKIRTQGFTVHVIDSVEAGARLFA